MTSFVIRKNAFLATVCACIVFNLASFSGAAEEGLLDNDPSSLQAQIFKKDRLSVQLTTGFLCSPVFIHKYLPTFNYAQTNLRGCWMLDDPGPEDSLLRGNFEAILEATGSYIYKGSGNYMYGATLLLRYNFLRPGWKLIPYIQGGAGMMYTDAYYYYALGQGFNFTPQGSLGARYLINKNWSVDLEGKFHHISNGGLDSSNIGVNAFGAFIGLTYYSDKFLK